MLKPSDIQLVILTVPRKPEYVHSTLASIFASDPLVHKLPPIQVMVGDGDGGYLDCYRQHSRIDVRPLEEPESKRILGWGPHRRMCHNYHRCLTVPLGRAKGMCVCEDDIVVCDGFISRLLATVEEMEGAHGLRKYLLACYAPYRLGVEPAYRRGRYFASYAAESYYGTQCMYYPAAVLDELADHMRRFGVDEHRAPADMLVKEYGIAINGVYGTVKSIAQHIGRQSTGLGGFHAAPTFGEELPTE